MAEECFSVCSPPEQKHHQIIDNFLSRTPSFTSFHVFYRRALHDHHWIISTALSVNSFFTNLKVWLMQLSCSYYRKMFCDIRKYSVLHNILVNILTHYSVNEVKRTKTTPRLTTRHQLLSRRLCNIWDWIKCWVYNFLTYRRPSDHIPLNLFLSPIKSNFHHCCSVQCKCPRINVILHNRLRLKTSGFWLEIRPYKPASVKCLQTVVLL